MCVHLASGAAPSLNGNLPGELSNCLSLSRVFENRDENSPRVRASR